MSSFTRSKTKRASNRRPVYQDLLEDLRSSLDEQKIEPGSWLKGENELADEYKISRISARKALDILCKEGYLDPIPGKGRRVLKRDRTNLNFIYLFSPVAMMNEVEGTYYGDMFRSLHQYCKTNNIVLHSFGHEKTAEEQNYLWSQMRLGTDTGIVFLAETDARHLPRLTQFHGPKVQVDHCIEEINTDSVEVDSFKGGQVMMEHLYELGHREFIYLGWHKEESLNPDRFKGVRSAANDRGFDFSDERCFLTTQDHTGGYDAIMKAHKNGVNFTAVLAFSSGMAVGAYKALVELGLKVPEDVSLISVGSTSDLTFFFNKHLTCIDPDPAGIMTQALDRLIWRKDHPAEASEKFYHDVTLVEGDTCGPVKK